MAYEVISPALVVFPAGNSGEGLVTTWYNWTLVDIKQNPSFKEYYFTGNKDDKGDVVVPLPYVAGNVRREK